MSDGLKIEGYLYKKSSGRVQRWQKRYFVLNPPLLTQAAEEDREPSRTIDLRKVHFVREKNPRNPKDGGFEIGYGHRLLHLRAMSADECRRWLRMLQSAVAPHQALGTALAQINENTMQENASIDNVDLHKDEHRMSLRRHSEEIENACGTSTSVSRASSATSTDGGSVNDVDSTFFGNRVAALEDVEIEDEFTEVPGEKKDIMEVIQEHWKITKNSDTFMQTVAAKFDTWLVVQAERRARQGLPLELESDHWEALLQWFLKQKYMNADLERTIMTGLEISMCEDMKDRIKSDLSNRMSLTNEVEKRTLPGSINEVPCSPAGSTLSTFAIRTEAMTYAPARERFTYALIGVLNYASQMMRRQFVSMCDELSSSVWSKFPGNNVHVPITSIAVQVNDSLYFSLVAKRLQTENNEMLACFEAFEKAFIALASEACKVWAEHFRSLSGVKLLYQRLWQQFDGPDFFDCLCKDAKRFCDEQNAIILPEAKHLLEIQLVRHGLIRPVLRELLREAPLRKITPPWAKPSSTECNHQVAKALKQHALTLTSIFKPSEKDAESMGIAALDDVREFLIADAPALEHHFVKLQQRYAPDFALAHAQSLMGWRSDLPPSVRNEVARGFRNAQETLFPETAESKPLFRRLLSGIGTTPRSVGLHECRTQTTVFK